MSIKMIEWIILPTTAQPWIFIRTEDYGSKESNDKISKGRVSG